LSEAIVVGSGPNGLACAVELAGNGLSVTVVEAEDRIGGGTRTSELTVPGLLHDDCSATHPMAAASPFLNSLDLGRHGLEWLLPEVELAHPLDDGTAGVMVRSIEETARGLGERDGSAWKRLFGSSSSNFGALLDDMMAPLIHFPRHPFLLARFGIPAAAPASLVARAWRSEAARALFGGVAAHALRPLNRPFSSSIGCALIDAGHAVGWPVAKGGSQAITEALAGVLRDRGGTIETGRRVTSVSELAGANVVVFDLAPGAVAEIMGERLPGRSARAYRRYRHGPAAFKVDLAIDGGVPWASEACRRAGTVHLIGGFDELAAAEAAVNRGEMPERPFVLVGQQYLADPSRSQGDVHPLWTYAHVPKGYSGDATGAILDQIERFAPGFRERIVGTSVRTPAEMEAYNANYVGGDIVTGANTTWQLIARPRLSTDPYFTGADGFYICSAATPPGAGAHGVCGYNAARSAIRRLGKRPRTK
jgi:phytoene dehydrogenase-like protein